uniref:2-oxoadipate dioxygenase/decarboxylase n=1 Tax=viral metagenome TaxID=1070528 RepID=A0A6C0F1E4_9ZZZZ
MNILQKIATFNKTNKTVINICEKYSKSILGVDHIAFRSLYKGMNKFDNTIYEKKNEVYHFPEYNVKANEYYKYNKFTREYPLRIFSSYYVGECHDGSILNLLKNKNIDFGEMYSYHDYLKIYNWNQYVAWTMLHKDTINHIAFQVDDLQKVTNSMIDDGFTFSKVNDQIINTSPDGNLLQSSHISIKNLYKFTDGYHNVPYTFLEFVERRNGREGFSESNANQIMHSTKGFNS